MADYLQDEYDLSDRDLVSVFDELPLWSSAFGIKLLDLVNYRTGMTALDIGCGTGFPLIELAQRLGKSSRVFGIDPWTAAYERISLKLKQMNVQNVTFINQPAEDLPFADESFDLIVSNNGINNVMDAGKVLDECYRTMRPDAQLIMSANLPGTFLDFYDAFRTVLSECGLPEKIKDVEKHIRSKRKTAEEYLRLLRERKFIIDEVIEDSFSMRYADGSAFLNHYFIRLAFLDSWKKIVPAGRLEEIFSKTESLLNDTASEKGQLEMKVPFIAVSCFK